MKIIPIGCSFDNYSYLLICEQTGHAAVIDPTEFYPLYKAITDHNVTLRAVLCTHHHHDHIAGLNELMDEYKNIEVFGFQGDERRIPGLTRLLKDGDVVALGDLQGEVLHTPGHTAGSICYHVADALFVGDTLFGCGCGRLFEGTPEVMFASLMEKIAVLPDATSIFFGHEYTHVNVRFADSVVPGDPEVTKRLTETTAKRDQQQQTTPSTLLLEKLTNPFLRCNDRAFIAKVCDRLSCAEQTPLGAFTALREARNSFS